MASSSSFSSASMALGDEKPHVLAVDDSLLDRKLIEKLLTNSSCKGIYMMPPLSFSLSWFSLIFFSFLFFFFFSKQTDAIERYVFMSVCN